LPHLNEKVLIALVILGGIKNIGKVTAFFVPIMALFYLIGGLIIMGMNFGLIPHTIGLIFEDAPIGSALGGGLLGTVIRYGTARGVFSNEAGLVSAPTAVAAKTFTDSSHRSRLLTLQSWIENRCRAYTLSESAYFKEWWLPLFIKQFKTPNQCKY